MLDHLGADGLDQFSHVLVLRAVSLIHWWLVTRLKDYRRLATRFDKLARNFAAAVALTALRRWYLI